MRIRASPFSMVRWDYLKSKPYGAPGPADAMYAQDFLAFSLTMFLAARSTIPGLKVPMILRTVAEDATRYFLVIFTSHFVLEMTLGLGRVSTTSSLSELQSMGSMMVSSGISSTSPGSVSHPRRTLHI